MFCLLFAFVFLQVQILNFDIYTWQVATNYDYRDKANKIQEQLDNLKRKMFDAKQVGTTPYYDAVSLIPALLPTAFLPQDLLGKKYCSLSRTFLEG